MVHKTSNSVIDTGIDHVPSNRTGIHKYNSTSNWLDDYDKQVDSMNDALDREYEQAEYRRLESESRIAQLQDEEELERQQEEEQIYLEQMRQLQLEKAKAEVESVKEQIRQAKRAVEPRPMVVTEQKPTLKQKIQKLGKKVAAVTGIATGHPEITAAAALAPVGKPKTVKKKLYQEPEEMFKGVN